jgi:hypothetical protein
MCLEIDASTPHGRPEPAGRDVRWRTRGDRSGCYSVACDVPPSTWNGAVYPRAVLFCIPCSTAAPPAGGTAQASQSMPRSAERHVRWSGARAARRALAAARRAARRAAASGSANAGVGGRLSPTCRHAGDGGLDSRSRNCHWRIDGEGWHFDALRSVPTVARTAAGKRPSVGSLRPPRGAFRECHRPASSACGRVRGFLRPIEVKPFRDCEGRVDRSIWPGPPPERRPRRPARDNGLHDAVASPLVSVRQGRAPIRRFGRPWVPCRLAVTRARP